MRLTPEAADELARLMALQGMGESAGVLVSVQGGGCQGLTYLLDLLEGPRPGLVVLETPGVRLFSDPTTARHLEGLVIHFVSDGLNRGFEFRNPRAMATCGCGSSFSVAP
jgi:iron-sulfur cluster assembly protein